MKEIQKVSITEAVAENIKELICSGDILIGSKLPTETSLCEQLNVSRTSVREACRLLQAQGYVEIRPGRGAFVADYKTANQVNWFQIDDAKYKDYMEVRIAIEVLAVRLAVELATEEQIIALEAIHSSFLAASHAHDAARMVLLDERFHSFIIDYSQNPLLKKINSDLLEVFRPYRRANFSNPIDYKHAEISHSKLLACFKERKPELAEQCMKEHLSVTAEDFDRIIPKLKRSKDNKDN